MKDMEDLNLFFQYYSCQDKSAATKNVLNTSEALNKLFNVSIMGTLSHPKSIFDLYGVNDEIDFYKCSVGIDGGILHQMPDRLIFVLSSYLNIFRQDIDVLYSRDILFMIFLSFPFVSRDYKVVYESHDRFSRRLFMPEKLEKRGLMEADRIMAVSEGLRRDFEKMGVPESHISVQRNCIDVEDYRFSPIEKEGKTVLTYVGSFSERKDVETLIDSYKILSKQKKKNFKLNLVGKKVKWVENAVNGLENVNYTGYRGSEKLGDYFEQSNIFIMTSKDNEHQRNYTSPMKLFEYMASGRPVISADLPTMRAIGGKNIYYYQPDNSEDLADKIDYVSKNYSKALEKAERALETVKNNYKLERKAENVKEVVKEI